LGSGALPLDRNGRFCGATVIGRSGAVNDNTEAVGYIDLVASGGGALFDFGSVATQFNVRVYKQVGTAGNTNITLNVLIFLKK